MRYLLGDILGGGGISEPGDYKRGLGMVLPGGRDSEGTYHTHMFTELGLWCEAPCPNVAR